MPMSQSKEHARMQFLPTSRMGRLAGWLALGFVLWFFVINNAIVVLRQRFDLLPRPLLIAQGLLGMGIGVIASGVALIAIVRNKERGVAVYLALVPGLLVVVFLIGELAFPH